MPKVEKRTARKDYPAYGISKGDTYYYYYTKIRQQRGGIVKRSLTPFKPSDLTTSEYLGTLFSIREAWEESDQGIDDIEAAKTELETLQEETSDKFENMPEGLQMGDTGQLLEARRDSLEEAINELDTLHGEMEELEEPEEPDEVEEPTDDEAPDFLAKTDAFETYQDDLTEYEEAQQNYESEIERIKDEVSEALNNIEE